MASSAVPTPFLVNLSTSEPRVSGNKVQNGWRWAVDS
jgi:hypothetical protein